MLKATGRQSLFSMLSAVGKANAKNTNNKKNLFVLVNQRAAISSTQIALAREVNPYPPIGTTIEDGSEQTGETQPPTQPPPPPPTYPQQGAKRPRVSRFTKVLVGSVLLTGVGTYAMVWYGKMDPRFRNRMNNAYPWTAPIFDYFLGPFGLTPYLIPAYEIKEGVKEKVNDVTEQVKDTIVHNVPLPDFIKNQLEPPKVVEEKSTGYDLAVSGLLPNADPAFFLGHGQAEADHQPKKVDPVVNDAYTGRLFEALKYAQDTVSEAVKVKEYLIQDYQHRNVFLINDTSIASRSDESDARRAIGYLSKVIDEGKASANTADNPYIRSAVSTAKHLTKVLNQLDYLTEVAKQEAKSDVGNSKSLWK